MSHRRPGTDTRYVARWAKHPPADAEVDDGPDWMQVTYDYLSVALVAAPYHAAEGPLPDAWTVIEQRRRPARSVLRQDKWVPTGRAWSALYPLGQEKGAAP